MGYSYGRNERGSLVLSCDQCGNLGGVRKRACPYTVLGDSLRTTDGRRHRLAYCSPPALCKDCYRQLGGLRGVHGASCAEGAALTQAHHDAIQAKLDAGEYLLIYGRAIGDGNVEAGFRDRDGTERVYIGPDVTYGLLRRYDGATPDQWVGAHQVGVQVVAT